MTDVRAGGPGDVKVGRQKKGQLSDRPPPGMPRYVEIDGRIIWRPNSPAIPDEPGAPSPMRRDRHA